MYKRQVEIFDLLEKRISKLNPDLNAIIQFPDDSRIKAKEAENDLYTKDKLAIFHGVPFTVKDCIDTQGILTTRGSKIFSSNRPNKDATVVKRMKDSGAILIGKTNMPEFALWWETANSLYGKTENPWSIGKTPGGSSGGEASAISAGLSPFGIGSDLGGSIRQPAAFCGIVGFKPSHGRVPLTGHWPNTLLRFMHVGPLSRSVRDIINGLIIMSGNDGNDYYSLKLPRFDFEHKNLDVKNIKVAYCYDGPFNPVSQEVKSNISRASEVFKDMGWNLKDQETKITSMWSIINKQNASNARHIHSNNYISAAYYVKAPQKCGNIVFYDPRSVTTFRYPKISTPNKLNTNIFSIQPKEGLLVLFPSYLYHSVAENKSDEERIVISFNICLLYTSDAADE